MLAGYVKATLERCTLSAPTEVVAYLSGKRAPDLLDFHLLVVVVILDQPKYLLDG